MARKRNTREKIIYRFEKAEKTARRLASYMKEIDDLACTRSVIVTGKCPPILNASLELADIIRDVGEQFSKE